MSGIYDEVDSAFQNVEVLNEEYLELLFKNVGEGDLTQEAEDYISQLEASKIKVKVNLEVAKQAQSKY